MRMDGGNGSKDLTLKALNGYVERTNGGYASVKFALGGASTSGITLHCSGIGSVGL